MTAPNYQLSMRSGPKPGATFPLDQEETLVGRDLANDIPIDDAEISRRHARFILQDEVVSLEDLGSTNGTFLNGERISSPRQLRVGDVITLGESIVMVFEKAVYEPEATVVSGQYDEVEPDLPFTERFEETPELEDEWQLQSPPDDEVDQILEEPVSKKQKKEKKVKKDGLPSGLIVLMIAIVVIACVIAVTLYFMPASWWCAVTFDMLEGCPLP